MAVFQLTGDAFGKVELPLAEGSGAEGDAKLSGATLIHDFVEPVRYHITATIGVDGKATIDTKLVEKESY